MLTTHSDFARGLELLLPEYQLEPPGEVNERGVEALEVYRGEGERGR